MAACLGVLPLTPPQIVKDIARTFPELLSNPSLQTNLFNVLKTYSVFDRELGYCQGLNFIAATLLSNLREPEEAFWVFTCLIKGRYDLRGFFASGVPELIVNLYCLDRCVELYLPPLFSHFKEQRVSPILFASEWFTTLFGYNFPTEFTRGVWTVFLSLGKVYLFRVAMGILKLQEKDLLEMRFEAIIMRLKNPVISLRDTLDEADRFSTIDERFLTALRKEAASHTTAENLL